MGEAAIIGGRASWLSSHGPALVPPNESVDRRGRDELGASCVPATLCSKRPRSWRARSAPPKRRA